MDNTELDEQYNRMQSFFRKFTQNVINNAPTYGVELSYKSDFALRSLLEFSYEESADLVRVIEKV